MANFIPFTPNGKIKIYRFVPLDETYENTLHFSSREEQLRYFGCISGTPSFGNQADCKLSFSGQTFTRNERQYVRIEGNACNYYDCNYMAFQNQLFGEMWFFAFIHTVEYVNDYCTEITFELDVMQSFMWNYELRECYVEREHTKVNEDKVGDSLTSEIVPNVAYKYTHSYRTNLFQDNDIILVTTSEINEMTHEWRKHAVVNRLWNVPYGGTTYACDVNDLGTFQNTLNTIAVAGGLDGIVTSYVFPRALEVEKAINFEIPKMSIENGNNIDGYVPANNKLFTYPFTVIKGDNGEQEQFYKQELFYGSPTKMNFQLRGVLGTVPQVLATPVEYDDPTTGSTDLSRTLVMTNFPTVQFAGDNFWNWFGQNMFKIETEALTSVTEIVGGAVALETTEGMKGTQTLVSGAKGVLNVASDIVTNMHLPPTLRTTAGQIGLYATNHVDIFYKVLQPTKEGAKVIDDFFTMYGYSTCQVKVPNVRFYNTCRPYFNYIKTRETCFHWDLFLSEGKGTSVPQRYMNKIKEIYQKGITFWKNPAQVGHYDELRYYNNPHSSN